VLMLALPVVLKVASMVANRGYPRAS
jgi:hypothetical protein